MRMVRYGRRWGWAPRVLVLALAVRAALPAPAVAAAPPGAAPVSREPLPPRGGRSGLQARIATLTRALSLDAGQQAALRTVLQDQRLRVQRIWNDPSVLAADRIAATRKVSTLTSERIRSLLNEEQRKKFDPPSQGDPGKTTRSVPVEDWIAAQSKH